MTTSFLYQSQKVTPCCHDIITEQFEKIKLIDQSSSNSKFDDDHHNGNDHCQSLPQQEHKKQQNQNDDIEQQQQQQQQQQDTKTSTNINKKVHFTTVQVREYARCLGDNPCASSDGPSLSLDWMYVSYNEIPLYQYEKHRKNKQIMMKLYNNKIYFFNMNVTNRNHIIYPLPGKFRKILIRMHTDTTHEELIQHMKDLDKVRRQRDLSRRHLPCFDSCRFLAESCKKRISLISSSSTTTST